MLTAADVGAFHALGISQAILAAARVERVDDVDAHRLLSTRRYGDLSGIVFPYVHPLTHQVVARRLRRDHPEVEGGKQKDKYIATYGDRRRLYFPPDCNGWLTDASVRLFVVEAEKSVLSLASAGAFAIGTGGCWGWRGRIGKVEDAAGNRVDELGPLPDLNYVTWADRDVCIAFDSNAAANANVRAARRGLARELTGRGAVVHVVDVPAEPGINGPDDYVGAHGAAAFFALADAAATTDGKAWPQTEIGDAECFADAMITRRDAGS